MVHFIVHSLLTYCHVLGTLAFESQSTCFRGRVRVVTLTNKRILRDTVVVGTTTRQKHF